MSFGQGRFRDQWARPWRDCQLLETHPRIRVGGLLGLSEVTIRYGDKTQTVRIEEEWWKGRYTKLRPWFRCPSCDRRCRLLVEKDGAFMCQPCSGYDYTCRHRHRRSPTLNKVRRGTSTSVRRIARETVMARIETQALLRATISALRRRAKRSGA